MEWTFERAIAGIMAITPFLESRAAMIETSASRKMLRVLDGVSGSRAEGLEDSLKLWFVLREGRDISGYRRLLPSLLAGRDASRCLTARMLSFFSL